MPELPEVETLRGELNRALRGKTFKAVRVLWPQAVAPLAPATFNRRLKNRQIKSLARRAKILLVNLDNGTTLAAHLKMTGQLIYQPRRGRMIIGGHPDDPTKYTRAVFTFSDGSRLLFNDLRKFGWLKILSTRQLAQIHGQCGLEPLAANFALKNFTGAVKRFPNRQLKQTLMDQTLIAGLGNIYSDEICFAAALRPVRRVKTLSAIEIKKLYRAIKQTLRLALKKGGTSIRDYRRADGQRGGFVPHLKVYNRAGKKCKRCGALIKKIKLAGRGTHYCPNCQK